MNQSKLLFTTLLAAAAASVPALAVQLDSDASEWNFKFTSTGYESVEGLEAAKDLMPQIAGPGDQEGTMVDPNYFVGSSSDPIVTGSSGSLQIGNATNLNDGNVYGVAITDAHKGTQTFTCAITGTGVFAVYRAAQDGTIFDFAGDVSKFSGEFYVNIFDSERSHTLKFSGAGTSAISGTGAITTNKTLTYAATSDATLANSSISAGTINISGSTLTASTKSITTDKLVFNGTGGGLSLTETGGSYSLGAIATTSSDNYARNLTVGSGVTATATSLTNSWGMGALTVNGMLDISGDLKFSTGKDESTPTETNKITGTGTIKAKSLTLGNIGTYNIDVARIEIGSGGIVFDPNGNNYTTPTVNIGKTTIAATEQWANDTNGSYLTFTLNDTLTLDIAKSVDGKGFAKTTASLKGKFTGDGSIVKTGAGELALSGASDYTGGTTISAGTLSVTSDTALGSGDITIQDGGTLQIAGGVTLANNVKIVLSNAYANYAAAALTGSGKISGAVTIVVDQAIQNAIAGGSTTYSIFGYGSSLSESSVVYQDAQGAKLSNLTVNEYGALTISLPEPSAFGLLAGLGALALVASRRRRTKKA